MSKSGQHFDTSLPESFSTSSWSGSQPTSPPRRVLEEEAIQQLSEDTANRLVWEAHARQKRKRFRRAVVLFVLTFCSTTLVGADLWPVDFLWAAFNPQYKADVLMHWEKISPSIGAAATLSDRFWESIQTGCLYSVPLMLILFTHEMGHFLQAVRYRVPASFPYFIPLPLPPLGTMGAVILQGRGVADRKMMFDIAVSGPIAGLIVTVPILYYGVMTSGYVMNSAEAFQFGQPLVVQWLIETVHGTAPEGAAFAWNGFARAGWVGVFITAMNLLPIGQLDGGHILYTLVGRKAHIVAWTLIVTAVAAMLWTGMYSYVLLLILLTLTGPRHPPTANDAVPIGRFRATVGWMTLAFLPIGFTLQPIIVPDTQSPGTNTEITVQATTAEVQSFTPEAL